MQFRNALVFQPHHSQSRRHTQHSLNVNALKFPRFKTLSPRLSTQEIITVTIKRIKHFCHCHLKNIYYDKITNTIMYM